MIRQEEVIRIGHFAKPHGIKGEITFIVDRDVFEEADEACYIVCDMEGILVPFFVEDFRYKTDTTMPQLVRLLTGRFIILWRNSMEKFGRRG